MIGQRARSESLFYYFRLEDQVPEHHLRRLIDKDISFEFVRQELKDSYSETGRPSIDPELLLRILLIGYLYGITSERKLVEQLRMHLAGRWFTGLGFDEEIPGVSAKRDHRSFIPAHCNRDCSTIARASVRRFWGSCAVSCGSPQSCWLWARLCGCVWGSLNFRCQHPLPHYACSGEVKGRDGIDKTEEPSLLPTGFA
jgi:hypothetical protein